MEGLKKICNNATSPYENGANFEDNSESIPRTFLEAMQQAVLKQTPPGSESRNFDKNNNKLPFSTAKKYIDCGNRIHQYSSAYHTDWKKKYCFDEEVIITVIECNKLKTCQAGTLILLDRELSLGRKVHDFLQLYFLVEETYDDGIDDKFRDMVGGPLKKAHCTYPNIYEIFSYKKYEKYYNNISDFFKNTATMEKKEKVILSNARTLAIKCAIFIARFHEMAKILMNYKIIPSKKVHVTKNDNVLHCLNTLEQIVATVASTSEAV